MMRSGRARVALLTTVAAFSLLGLPSVAQAGTASIVGSGASVRASYVADDGEVNAVTVSQAAPGADYVITDTAGVDAGPGCDTQPGDPFRAVCPDLDPNHDGPGYTSFEFELSVAVKDRDDSVLINLPAPIPGTSAASVYIGAGGGNDLLRSIGSSWDSISGFGGDDVIDSGPGNDQMFGEEQADIGNGADTFLMGNVPEGSDSMTGGRGTDTIDYSRRTAPLTIQPTRFGVSGELGEGDALPNNDIEVFKGGSGDDLLNGFEFPTILVGGPGADVMCGGAQDDTVDYSADTSDPAAVGVTVTLGLGSVPDTDPPQPGVHECITGGDDQLRAQRDKCYANDGGPADRFSDCVAEDVENIIGTPRDDTLIGTDPRFNGSPVVNIHGRNRFNGLGGNDLMDGLLADDTYVGGGGIDTVSYAGRTAGVQVTTDGAADDGDPILDADLGDPVAPTRESVGPDVENVIGSSGDDVLVGNENTNTFRGESGNDRLDGGSSDDRLCGGEGNDQLDGAGGNDALDSGCGDDGPGNDDLDGGTGSDTLSGGLGDDRLDGGQHGDGISGGSGTDLADYSAALTPVTVDPNGLADDGGTGEGDNVATDIESINGGIDNDRLVGNGGDGVLAGGGGDDILDGALGADTIVGGEGNDEASYATRVAPVNVNLTVPGGDGEAGENDNVSSDVEEISGGAANDSLTGDGSDDGLDGGAGNDLLNGAGGNDLLFGRGGIDTLNGGDGRDILFGHGDNDILKGGAGPDGLNGGLGDDMLDGEAGPDTLSGNNGSDTADYSARSTDVKVALDGGANNGATGEGDVISTDVGNVKTGGGDDTINSRDGKVSKVSCGAGSDVVKADVDDDVAGDCEQNLVGISSVCQVPGKAVPLSGSTVALKVKCIAAGTVTVTLTTASAVRAVNDSARKRARKLRLGSKRVTVTKNRSKTVKVKLSKSGKRLVQRRKSLRVTAAVAIRRKGAVGKSAISRSSKTLTIRTAKKGSKK